MKYTALFSLFTVLASPYLYAAEQPTPQTIPSTITSTLAVLSTPEQTLLQRLPPELRQELRNYVSGTLYVINSLPEDVYIRLIDKPKSPKAQLISPLFTLNYSAEKDIAWLSGKKNLPIFDIPNNNEVWRLNKGQAAFVVFDTQEDNDISLSVVWWPVTYQPQPLFKNKGGYFDETLENIKRSNRKTLVNLNFPENKNGPLFLTLSPDKKISSYVKHPVEPLYFINTLPEDVYVRLVSGPDSNRKIIFPQGTIPYDSTTDMLAIDVKKSPLLFDISNNNETWKLKTGQAAILPIDLKDKNNFPIRVLVWPKTYQPKPDVDNRGKSIQTSEENRNNSINQSLITENNAFELMKGSVTPVIKLYHDKNTNKILVKSEKE